MAMDKVTPPACNAQTRHIDRHGHIQEPLLCGWQPGGACSCHLSADSTRTRRSPSVPVPYYPYLQGPTVPRHGSFLLLTWLLVWILHDIPGRGEGRRHHPTITQPCQCSCCDVSSASAQGDDGWGTRGRGEEGEERRGGRGCKVAGMQRRGEERREDGEEVHRQR